MGMLTDMLLSSISKGLTNAVEDAVVASVACHLESKYGWRSRRRRRYYSQKSYNTDNSSHKNSEPKIDEDFYAKANKNSQGKSNKSSYSKVNENSYSKVNEDSYGKVNEDSYGKVNEDSYGKVNEDSYAKANENSYAKVNHDSYEAPHKEYAKSSSAKSHTAAPKAKRKFKPPSGKSCLITLLIIVIAVTALGIYEVTKSIPVQYAADTLVGDKYTNVVAKLEKAGFTNVSAKEIADLPLSQISDEYLVTEVKIGWSTTFTEIAKLPSNSPVTVTYHTLEKVKAPMSSDRAKGTNYKDVQTAFKNAGFTNVKTDVVYDLILGWFTEDGEVESVTVGGDEAYSTWSKYKVNTEVVITYHTFISNEP